MSDLALRVDGVTKWFAGHLGLRRRTVIQDLSMEVRRGEVFGFLGANGAGKTTTIKMIVALIFPSRGSIEVLGRSVEDVSARTRLGFLPEHPYFYDYLTGAEFLRYYGKLYGMDARSLDGTVRRVLSRVGLEGQGQVPLRKYSKGMVQRIGLAQAIMNEPELVVLDEPMSGLDPIGRRDVRDIMVELKERGTTVFFSSHILQDAEMICDRVGILSGGRLVREGRLAELLKGDVESWEVLLADVPVDALSDAEHVSRRGDGDLFRVRTAEGLGRTLDAARKAGGRVVQVTPQRRSLEDLFLESSAGGR